MAPPPETACWRSYSHKASVTAGLIASLPRSSSTGTSPTQYTNFFKALPAACSESSKEEGGSHWWTEVQVQWPAEAWKLFLTWTVTLKMDIRKFDTLEYVSYSCEDSGLLSWGKSFRPLDVFLSLVKDDQLCFETVSGFGFSQKFSVLNNGIFGNYGPGSISNIPCM